MFIITTIIAANILKYFKEEMSKDVMNTKVVYDLSNEEDKALFDKLYA